MLPQNVWIIIPAHNEEENISKVINDLKEFTSNIVVVNDGSTDNTSQICKTNGVIVVDHLVNRGQGASLQTGNEFALSCGAEIIVHFDADGQHRVADLEKVIEPLLNGQADIVFGSRFLEKNSKVHWFKKYFILKPAIFFNWFFTGLKLSDAHNGFRALSQEAAKKIKIEQDGMAHATEIMNLVRQKNLRHIEVPVEIIYQEFGQGIIGGLKIIEDLFISKLIKK
ncbi:glycosyltransferase family 2 protein [Candidatus Falkowbacteria bacterium]|nr:glycosyltransferase family 2 protein [Candidatus Falkowbacteria bacterium]